MLINKDKNIENVVKFIEYTGKYPNLCRGILTLEIKGEIYKFGHDYTKFESWKTDGNFDSFWESGGSCGFTNNYEDSYCNQGEWIINADELPEQFKKYSTEIDEVFNENVPYGCCGGCL